MHAHTRAHTHVHAHTDVSGGVEQEGDMEDVDPLSEFYGMDDQLSPLEKLERYFQSNDGMDR